MTSVINSGTHASAVLESALTTEMRALDPDRDQRCIPHACQRFVCHRADTFSGVDYPDDA